MLTTPGHTSDSISLLVAEDRALLTGDMVLGRGTTVIVHPDGDLGGYFDSIAKMRALVSEGRVDTLWPAHGPVLPDAAGVLDYYVVHRRERLAQVEAALTRLGMSPAELPPDVAEHPTLPRQVVEVVYSDVDESLWGAAEWSVRAQLAYLAAAERSGDLIVVRSPPRSGGSRLGVDSRVSRGACRGHDRGVSSACGAADRARADRVGCGSTRYDYVRLHAVSGRDVKRTSRPQPATARTSGAATSRSVVSVAVRAPALGVEDTVELRTSGDRT